MKNIIRMLFVAGLLISSFVARAQAPKQAQAVATQPAPQQQPSISQSEPRLFTAQPQNVSTGKTYQSEMNDFDSQFTDWYTSQLPNLMKKSPLSNLTFQHFFDHTTPNAIEMGEIDKLIIKLKISPATYAEITRKYINNLEVRDALIENFNNKTDQLVGIYSKLKDGKITYSQFNEARQKIWTASSLRIGQIEQRVMDLEEAESKDPGVNGIKLPQCKRYSDRHMCFDVNEVRRGDGFYVGQWKNNRAEGYGIFTERIGDIEVVYAGNFSNGREEGNGTLSYSDGRKYVGTFHKSIFHGAAQFVTTDGTTFIGEFRTGGPLGKGRLVDKNGNEYSGDILYTKGSAAWVDIRSFTRQGRGILSFTNGEKYEGEFVNNKFDGRGTFTHADGNKSIGLFKDDGLFEGTGLLKSTDYVYVGEIRNFEASGKGEITTSEGTKYTGTFLNGTPNGHGTAIYRNGNKYVGQFIDGESHGQGTLTLANGTVQTGLFRNDQYIPEKQIAAEKKKLADIAEAARVQQAAAAEKARVQQAAVAAADKKRAIEAERRPPIQTKPGVEYAWEANIATCERSQKAVNAGSFVCITKTEYKKLCNAATEISQSAYISLTFTDPRAGPLADGGDMSNLKITWEDSDDPRRVNCRVQFQLKGIVKGTSSRATVSGGVSSFFQSKEREIIVYNADTWR